MPIRKSLAASLLAIAVLGAPALAEPQRTLSADVSRHAANQARPVHRKALPQMTFTASSLDLKLIPLANMDGWTPITNTATRGGASLYSFKGQMTIATTGSDNTLYLAPFNAVKPVLISSLDWENLDEVTFTSQPECQASQRYTDKPDDYEVVCLGLGTAGNARLALIGRQASATKVLIDADLGGHDAGSAPAYIIPPTYSAGIPMADTPYFKQNFDSTIAVWGGANAKLFIARVSAGNYPEKLDSVPNWKIRDAVKWDVPAEPFTGVPGCSKTLNQAVCAAATADGKIRVFPVLSYGALTPLNWKGASSAPLDAGLSGEVALEQTKAGRSVILARGKDGKLYQTVWNGSTFSAWKPEGGYMIARTRPACVTINEAAVCVVQGSDGRLYAKQLSSAGAL